VKAVRVPAPKAEKKARALEDRDLVAPATDLKMVRPVAEGSKRHLLLKALQRGATIEHLMEVTGLNRATALLVGGRPLVVGRVLDAGHAWLHQEDREHVEVADREGTAADRNADSLRQAGVICGMAILDHRSGGLCCNAWKRVDLGGVDLAEGFDHPGAVLALPVVIVLEPDDTDQAQDAVLVGELGGTEILPVEGFPDQRQPHRRGA